MASYTYSLVIPSRNSPELLQRCLETIPRRPDLEVIIVDDNSDPAVVDFSVYPGLGRPDTKVLLTKEGRGAGYARNVGMQHAGGRWLIFSDSDDTFNVDLFAAALDKYAESPADLVCFNSRRISEESGEVLRIQLDEKRYRRNPQKYLEYVRYHLYAPWGKFFKREMVQECGARFNEVQSGNDLMFSTLCGHYAKDVRLDFSPIYDWHKRTSGSISSNRSQEIVDCKLDQERLRNDFLCSVGKGKHGENMYIAGYINYLAQGMTACRALRLSSRYIRPLERPRRLGHFLLWRIKKMLGL